MRKRVLIALVLIGGLLSLVWLASSQSTASRSLTKAEPSTTPSMPSKEAVFAKLATLERGWVKNEGQWDQRALFSAPGYFGNTWITKDGELLHVAVKKEECKDKTEKAKACPSKSWVISERWVGGKVQAVKGEEELQTKVSYFIGNDPSKHRSNLPTYRYVSLGEVWSGIEVKLKATQKTVEKLFYVQPGADPSKIQVQVDGAKGLKLSKDGEIIIKTGLGDLKLSKPIAWQEKDGKKLPVKVSYKLIGKNRYSFVVAKADPSLPIVIDPILQATYLGGSDSDGAYALAIHPTTGEVYVAGATSSNDFPVTTGVVQESYRGGIGEYPYDAFVARLNSTLTQILKATYLGGSGGDDARALAIHPTTGEVYVAGATSSNDFPNTDGGAKESKDDYMDAFVAKLDSDLTSLQSTYLGGSRWDGVYALAISSDGYVYVAGETSSDDFPNTDGGAQENFGGDSDAFVVKLDSTLTNSSFQATYLGGSSDDGAYAIAIHPTTGDVYVAGKTRSFNFPNTDGGAQGSKGNYYDAFVAKLNSDLTSLQSTYLGGNGDYDEAYALAISGSDVYVAGETDSNDFPGTSSRASSRTDADAFVAKLNSDLTSLQSTYLGGSDDDYAYALAISSDGYVYVAGYTDSTNFPGTSGGAQENNADNGGYFDAFVARLRPDLQTGAILQSTYLGGSGTDSATALAISGSDVYVAGWTSSTNFPRTTGGARGTYGGGERDAFVAKLSADLAADSGSGGGGGGGGGGGSTPVPPTLGVVSSGYAGPQGGVEFGDAPINTQKVPAIIKLESANPIFISDIRINEFSGQSILQGITDFFRGLFGLKEQEGSFILDLNAGDKPCGSKSFVLAGYCTVGVIFQPKSEGKKQAYLEIYYDYIYLVKLYMTGTGVSQQQAPPPGGSGGSSGGGGGGGCSMTGSASFMAGFGNILVWLSIPAFIVARRIRKR
jgi:hypothetical protein